MNTSPFSLNIVRMSMASCIAVAVVCLALVSNGGETNPAGKINFVAKNAFATANGVFHEFSIVDSQITLGEISKSHVTVEIDVASVDTDSKRRDDHLRTADFFEVEKWPTATVRVHSAEQIEGARYRAKFDVAIRDARKTIDGEFEIVSEAPLSVRGSLVIDRMDFAIGTPKTWNPMSITNEVPVTFEATLPD